MKPPKGSAAEESPLPPKSDPWTDLALTLPIFLVYHLGVVLLPMKNAADMVTHELRDLASHSLIQYFALTLAIGVAFVAVLSLFGRGHAFQKRRFVAIALEGAVYAGLMQLVASQVVGALPLGPKVAAGLQAPATLPISEGLLAPVVMSLGAGFYEEVVFRVIGFGAIVWLLERLFDTSPKWLIRIGWGLVVSLGFSAWHYVGAYGDGFSLHTFIFRTVCGLVLTGIYGLRGFAPAVWTHAIYDVWVLLIRG